MYRLGILSDTHGHFEPRLAEHFASCDEIWHAGDIGDTEVCRLLQHIAPLVAVYGNIDGQRIRTQHPLHQRQKREGLDIWMTHIGGYPGAWDRRIRDSLRADPPGLMITGHSHILKIIPDPELGLLHINPGSAGRYGFHQVRTAVRAEISGGRVVNADVIEFGKRSSPES